MHSPRLTAALWMIGAIISFTSMAVAGRAVSFELDTFEIMLFRSAVGLLIVVLIAGLRGRTDQFRTSRLQTHVLRNLAHFAGQNLWFYAITVIPLAQVFALEFTTPIWAIFFSALILGERITRWGMLAAVLGFAGILIVARPDMGDLNAGLIAAAAAAIGFALTAVGTRTLTRTETILTIMFWLTLTQLVFGLVCAGIDGDIALPSSASLPWLMVIAGAGLVAHFCLTKALAIAPAATVMPVDFARLPVIAAVGVLLYGEPLDPLLFLGAALIFVGNYLNLTRGQVPNRQRTLAEQGR